MKKLYQKTLSGFLVFAMLLTLVPPIVVHATEESKLPNEVALSTVLGQEVDETNVTVADTVYSAETSISVTNDITSVKLSDFEKKDSKATLYFYGKDSNQDNKENSEAVELEAGKATTVYVKVVAADDSVSSKYTITINKEAVKEGDEDGKSISDKVKIDTVLGKELTIDKKKYVEMAGGAYKLHKVAASLSVGYDVEAISRTDIVLQNSTSTFGLINNPEGSGVPENSISLEAGEEKTITIVIHAADMSIHSAYCLTISRAKNPDENKNSITDKVEIDTVLGKEMTINKKKYVEMAGGAYKLHKIDASLSVDYDVETISRSDIALKDATSTFGLINNPEGSGVPEDSISLESGEEKTITIIIHAADMSIHSAYCLTISRAKKDDANDNGIPDKVELDKVLGKIPTIVSKKSVSEGKAYEIKASVTVNSEVKSISLDNFNVKDKDATIEFLGTNKYGRPTTEPVSLVAGENTMVYLRIYAQDGTVTGIYTITIESDDKIVEITKFKTIELYGGTTDNTVYNDVYAITSYLSENYSSVIISNTNDMIPVTKWKNTNKYDPDTVGKYIFTAELGKIPKGYTLGKDVTATAVVIIYDKTQVVDIKDNVLKEKLCDALRVEKNHDITVGELMGLTGTLDLSKSYGDSSIQDYSGLCHAKNITKLDLSSNNLSSVMSTNKLSDLSYLTKLKILNLNGTGLTSLPNMKNMTKLEELYVDKNSLTDVSQLKKLTTLENLSISSCNLDSLPDLSELVRLKYLDISKNNITTLENSGIEELVSLTEFIGTENKLTAIDLSKLKNLTHLKLGGNKLTSIEVKNLPELIELYLSKNALTNIKLDKLPKLTTLIADNNELTSISEDICNIKSIETLELGNNSIRSINKNISNLIALPTLNLENNNIAVLPDSINNMSNLEKIQLQGNKLANLPEDLDGLTNLKTLDLDSNRFEILPDSIGDLTGLTSLDVHGNKLKALPASMGKLIKLSTLNMSYNNFSKFPSSISKLIALKEISMNQNSLTDVNVDSEGNVVDLRNLTNVTSVDFSYNEIEQLPQWGKTLSNLKTLNMSNNYISNIPKGYLKNMKNLDDFKIDFNYINWNNDFDAKKEIQDFLDGGHSASAYNVNGLFATLKVIDTSVGSIVLKNKNIKYYSYNFKASVATPSITIKPTSVHSETKITVNNNTINSGESFTIKGLKSGINEITLVATNKTDNSTVKYKIAISIPKEGEGKLDLDHLPDGTYAIDIDAMRERENILSMTDQFVRETAKVKIENGKMTLTMVWSSSDLISIKKLEGLWYKDENGEYVSLIIPDDDPDTYGKYTYSKNVKYDAEKEALTITLPVESITEDKYLKVYAPTGMEEYKPELRIVFNTDTLVDMSTGKPLNTIKLESIVLDTTNVKKEYKVGEALDLSGLVATGTYDNGTQKTLNISEANVTGFDSSSAVKSQTLTVMVNGKTATYDISIKGEQIAVEDLKDGEYIISAVARHYYEPNEFSMANQFIKKPATLKVKDGKISVKMLWESTNISLSSLKELRDKNSDGEFVNTTRTYDPQNDTVTVECQVETLKKPKIFQVYVPEEMGETRQKFKLVFNLDTLKLVKAYEKDRDQVIEKLQKAIGTQIDQTKKYTKESYKVYKNALKVANAINTKTATVQEIDKAAKALENAIASLEERVEVTIDKNHLKQEIQGITDKKKKIVINGISEELAKTSSVKIPVGAVEDAKMEVPVKLNAQGKKETILPKLEITSNHGSVTMPAGIKVTGDENWDGIMKMPTTVKNEAISNINGTPKMAISLGVDDKTLTFDQPVKIVLPNQAGKKVAFIRKEGDAPTEISHTLLAAQNTSEAAGKAMKAANVAEAKLDVGQDLVIWTTHFTTFVAYEEANDLGTTGGGPAEKGLTNGTHRIKAWAKHFYENGKSMADQFIKRATTLEVQDEKVTVRMVWDSTNISLSKLKELKYENSSGELVNTRRSYDATNDSLEIELEVKKEAIKEGITCQVYVPDGMGETRQKFKLMFDLDSLDNVSLIIKEAEKIENGSYEADIKILKESEDKASIAESYFLKKGDVKVESDKNHVRLFIKNKEDIKDLKIEVDGNNVAYETKIVKEYDNGKKANMIKFEIPKLDATIKLKAKIVPEDNKEVTFRVVLDQDKMKKKTDDSIDIYLNLLEGKIIKAVDLSKNGLYEMTMEVKETDKSLLAMVQKYLVDEINYEVIKGKNYVQVMLKNVDEIKDLKVYVNSMGAKYEKITNNEKNTVIRFEVPDAAAKIRFSICMSEKKEGYTGFDIKLKKATAKELQEKIYLYIQLPKIVDVKKGETKNIQLDVAPLIEENRTLVPLRGICETLGAKVKWEESTRSILLSDGDMKIELQLDQKSAKVNGKTIKMDVAPKIINERTFVPIRFISESLKHEVKWVKEEQKIVITKKVNMVEKTDTNKK